jgi:hypothetical protein
MTFVQLQNRVMERLNLTSTEARTRIKAELNDRYREVQSAVNLARTRRGVKSFNTVSGNANVTVSGVAKLLNVYDPVILKRPLDEATPDQIRVLDAAGVTSGPPRLYAVQVHSADEITLLLWPKPASVSGLKSDAILAGTDMSADADEPSFPEDYHDILVHGVLADEYAKIDKLRPAGDKEEAKFEKRLGELRYFIISSGYLNMVSNDRRVGRTHKLGVIGIP